MARNTRVYSYSCIVGGIGCAYFVLEPRSVWSAPPGGCARAPRARSPAEPPAARARRPSRMRWRSRSHAPPLPHAAAVRATRAHSATARGAYDSLQLKLRKILAIIINHNVLLLCDHQAQYDILKYFLLKYELYCIRELYF